LGIYSLPCVLLESSVLCKAALVFDQPKPLKVLMRTQDILLLIGLLFSWSLLAQPKKEVKEEIVAKPAQEFTTILGEASGIGSRYWLNQTMSIEVRAEFDLFPVEAAVLSSAYHLSFVQITRKEKDPLPLYIGAGIKLGGAIQEAAFVFGFAAPIGIGLPFSDRLNGFVELAPGGLLVKGAVVLDLDASVGIRYSLATKKGKGEEKRKEK
jgi:hypothetical protein